MCALKGCIQWQAANIKRNNNRIWPLSKNVIGTNLAAYNLLFLKATTTTPPEVAHYTVQGNRTRPKTHRCCLLDLRLWLSDGIYWYHVLHAQVVYTSLYLGKSVMCYYRWPVSVSSKYKASLPAMLRKANSRKEIFATSSATKWWITLIDKTLKRVSKKPNPSLLSF